MEQKVKPIVVPWDFSQVAEYALQHALQFSKQINSEVYLLHIIKKESEEEEALTKLKEIADRVQSKQGLKLQYIAREGHIFRTISEVVDELDAIFVVMGTHGMKGMQKFTGSWALKVIAGSKAPFLVVQGPPLADDGYHNIVFPIDFKQENKEKLKWANYLSKLYRTKFEICKPKSVDKLLNKKITSNLIFAKKYLDEKGIDYEISTVDGDDNFAEETIKFAIKKKADLILIMTTKRISFQDYVLGAHEQLIIANEEKIPVMCVNPLNELKRTGFFYS